MAKSILFVTGIFPPDIGGPATYVSNLSKELKSRGHKIHIITLGETSSSTDITYISRKLGFFKRNLRIKKEIEKRKEYDIVYAQDPFGVGLGFALANTKSRKILKVVGDNVWEIAKNDLGVEDSIDAFQTKNYNPKIWFMKKIQNYVVKKAETIITPSKYLKKIVSNWGVNPSKIKVIYNAVTLSKEPLKETKEELKKELGLTGKNYITIARLTPWKGIDVLIDIFKNRNKENLIIIGDGPLYEKYLEISKKTENIKVLGKKSNTEVKKYLHACDAFILNSGYEGLPHVVIEAFECNCPVLLSNVCGNPEIVKDKYSGILFEYDNKKSVIKAIKSLTEKKAKIYTQNAKKSLHKFDWENLVKQVLEVLNE